MADEVLIEVDGPVLTIVLNRPHVRNAVDLAVCRGVSAALRQLERDPKLRAGVITGTGTTFCSGADLKAAEAGDSMAIGAFDPGAFAGFVRFPRTKPVICAAQGHALAGGLEILMACELAVGAVDALFGLPEVRIGIMAAAGGTIGLGRDFSFPTVMKMLLTGRPIDAAEAYRIGLLTEIAENEHVRARAETIGREIAEVAPQAVAASLQLARAARAGACSPDGLQDLSASLIAGLLDTPDAAEGRQAFLEKRNPNWSTE